MSSIENNVLRLLPPLTIAAPLLDDGLSVLESAVGALGAG